MSSNRGIVVRKRLSLEKIGMSEEQATAWAAALNEELEGTEYHRAVLCNDGTLALDACLADQFVTAMEQA